MALLKEQAQSSLKSMEFKTFLRDSSLVFQLTEKELIQTWIHEKKFVIKKALTQPKFKTSLLFRATDDGFEKERFQELCGGKGPLLILIKSHLDKVFGGYCSIKWPTNK